MARLPGSVLFACSQNSIRSPMAEALLKHYHGKRVFVDSAGLRSSPVDPFAVAVMAELGIDLAKHRSKTFDDLLDSSFDLVITLSPEAHHRAMEMTRTMACDVEYWPTFDPSVADGSREAVLDAYRSVRDEILAKIKTRFPLTASPSG
jgi:protein-tyrosine-phosphatase